MKYREPNSSCFNCGRQLPTKARRHDHGECGREYICPECGEVIVTGVVATDGEIGRTPITIPPSAASIMLPRGTDWNTWEAWWTDYLLVVAMHGRVVDGNGELLKYVNRVKERA